MKAITGFSGNFFRTDSSFSLSAGIVISRLEEFWLVVSLCDESVCQSLQNFKIFSISKSVPEIFVWRLESLRCCFGSIFEWSMKPKFIEFTFGFRILFTSDAFPFKLSPRGTKPDTITRL